MLPHFTLVESDYKNYEPIYKNLFEVNIIMPTVLIPVHPNAGSLLLENVTSIKLPTYQTLNPLTQRFKYSTRKFLAMPDSTSLEDISINVQLNQNDNYQMFCWRYLKDWYDLAWNNEDGSIHYKKNLIGDILVHIHDKEGHVIRRVVYKQAMLNTIGGWDEMNWETNEIVSMTASFVVDYFEDYYY
jgi:hypothetical protein